MLIETATIHRYRGGDEDRFGIADGTLVAVTPADYDDEKVIIHFTLPGLANPQCAAYLTDIGPQVGQIDITARDAEPWGMMPADPDEVPGVVTAIEERERRDVELMASAPVVEAIALLREAGVTAEQAARALRRAEGP